MEELSTEAAGATETAPAPINLDERVTLTIDEVARLTGLPISNVYTMARKGKLKSIRKGKRILIPKQVFLEEFTL